MTSHEHPARNCPGCDYRMNVSTCVTPGHEIAEPKPGDLSICLNCGMWLEFNDILVPLPMSEAARASLDDQNRTILERASAAIMERGFIPKFTRL